MSEILLVEDEPVIRTELRRLLERHGHKVLEAGSVEEATAHPLGALDLVITDLRLPGSAGTEMIARAAGVPVLIMTSYATVPSAVESMKLGAADYISKPFAHTDLVRAVEQILEKHRATKSIAVPPPRPSEGSVVSGMIGDSSAMRDVFDRIRRIAPPTPRWSSSESPGRAKSSLRAQCTTRARAAVDLSSRSTAHQSPSR